MSNLSVLPLPFTVLPVRPTNLVDQMFSRYSAVQHIIRNVCRDDGCHCLKFNKGLDVCPQQDSGGHRAPQIKLMFCPFRTWNSDTYPLT
ncbi:hypothetical protein F4604DRAFT_964460 [Suillus subluteus]|nr:hypothetical protein F4604DRAFT_964460 [Suillus subluteus]